MSPLTLSNQVTILFVCLVSIRILPAVGQINTWGSFNKYSPGFTDPGVFVYNDALYRLRDGKYLDFAQDHPKMDIVYRMTNLETFDWETIPLGGEAPSLRTIYCGYLIGDQYFMFGGFNNGYSNDLYILNVKTWTWTFVRPTGELPPQRTLPACFGYKGNFYIQGGSAPVTYIIDGWMFNQGKNQWSRVAYNSGVPFSVFMSANAFSGDTLYKCGGFRETGLPVSICDIFNLTSSSWTSVRYQDQAQKYMVALYGQATAVLNNKLYILNGINDLGQLSSYQYIIDLQKPVSSAIVTTINQQPDLVTYPYDAISPQRRYSATLTYFRKKFILTGGTSVCGDDTIWVLDPDTMKWSNSFNAYPMARTHTSVAKISESVFAMYGGVPTCTSSRYLNDLWKFDIVKKSWTQLSPLSLTTLNGLDAKGLIAKRPAFGYFNNMLYLIGGHAGNGAPSVSYQFSLITNTWSALTLPGDISFASQYMQAASLFDGELFYFWGGLLSPNATITPTSTYLAIWNMTSGQVTKSADTAALDPRIDSSLFIRDGLLHVFGGIGITDETPYNDIFVLNQATGAWKPLNEGDSSLAPSGASLLFAGLGIYLGGLDYYQNPYGDMSFYDFKTEKWTLQLPPTLRPPPLYNQKTIRMGNYLVMVGASYAGFNDNRVLFYDFSKAFCTQNQLLSASGKSGLLNDGSHVSGYFPFSRCSWIVTGANNIVVKSVSLDPYASVTITTQNSCGDDQIYATKGTPSTSITLSSMNNGTWYRIPGGDWKISFASSGNLVSSEGFDIFYLSCPTGFLVSNYRCECPPDNYITLSGECYPCPQGTTQSVPNQNYCTSRAIVEPTFDTELYAAVVDSLSNPLPSCQQSQLTEYDDAVYLFCVFPDQEPGFRNSPVLVYRISVNNKISWEIISTGGVVPSGRIGACIIQHQNYVYYVGGYSLDGDKSVFQYSFSTKKWKALGTSPINYSGHSCAAFNEKLYLHGGESLDGEALSDIQIYDIGKNTWNTLTSATWINSPSLSNHISWIHGGYMYLFGGFNGVQESSEVHYAAISTTTTFTSKDIPLGSCLPCVVNPGQPCNILRQSMGYFQSESMLYIYGGLSSHLTLRDIIGIDLASVTVVVQSVFLSAPLPIKGPPALYASSILVQSGNLILYGGIGVEDGDPSHNIFVYDLKMQSWITSTITQEPLPREDYSITKINDDTFAIFGGNVMVGSQYYSNDVWIYYGEYHKWVQVASYSSGLSTFSPRIKGSLSYYSGALYGFGGNTVSPTVGERLWKLNISDITKDFKGDKKWQPVDVSKFTDALAHHVFERVSASSILIGDTIWIWGGQVLVDTGTVEDYRSVFTLSLKTFELKPIILTSGPIPRSQHSTFACPGGFCILGGNDFRNRIMSDIWVFSIDSKTWARLDGAGAPLYISKTFAASFRSHIVAVGGLNQASEKLNSINVFQLETQSWNTLSYSDAEKPMIPLSGLSGVKVTEGVIFYGGSSVRSLSNTVFSYKPSMCDPRATSVVSSLRDVQVFHDPSGPINIPRGTYCSWFFSNATDLVVTERLEPEDRLMFYDGMGITNNKSLSISQIPGGIKVTSFNGLGITVVLSVPGVFDDPPSGQGFSIDYITCPKGATYNETTSTCTCPPKQYEGKFSNECVSCAGVDGLYGCPSLPSDSDMTTIAIAVGCGVGGFLVLVIGVSYKRYRDHLKELSEKENALFMHVRYDELDFGKLLGVGSFGEVYIGKWRETDVAIKRLNAKVVTKEVIKAFEDEVSVMVQLRHPNVVLYMAACVEPGKLCIISELMSRGSLHGILHNESLDLDYNMRLRFLLDAAKGLQYLHMSTPPILHRDLKSPNLLLDEKWNCKISDFGLTGVRGKTSATNEPPGTLLWMAPEVVDGKEYTEKSDIFSFAVIMWEVFSRAEPYEGEIAESVALRVLNEGLRPRELSADQMPSEVQYLMNEAWAQDPAARPTFSNIVKQLSMFIEEKASTNSFMSMTNTSKTDGKEQAPTGKVVLVFTGVEEATTIWEQHADAMNTALVTHNDLMRGLLKRNHGYEVKTEGDAFMIAFPSTSNAIMFCHQAQEMLLASDWPAEILTHPSASVVMLEGREIFNGLRVHMGIHIGEPLCKEDPVSGRMDYFGPVVNRSARVASVPVGGQVVLSSAAYEDISSNLSSIGNPLIRDLGDFELKGLASAERIYEILPQSLSGRASFFSNGVSDSVGGLNVPKTGEGKSEPKGFTWQISVDNINVTDTELGAGSFGTVFLGNYDGREVAVKKFMKQKMAEKQYFGLLSEIMLMRELDHPYILKFIGASVKQPNIFFVMEYARYGSIRTLLANPQTNLTDETKRNMLWQVAEAMKYLHLRKPPIIHRDLKSPNVLVISMDPIIVKICDFGLARVKSDNQTMTKCGTRAWLAPEVLKGLKYSEKADLYSYAIMIWEIITRERPYEGMDPLKLSMEVVNGLRPTVPKTGDKVLINIMKRCWVSDDTKRPSFAEVADEIQQAGF